jgi:hypothetical protein
MTFYSSRVGCAFTSRPTSRSRSPLWSRPVRHPISCYWLYLVCLGGSWSTVVRDISISDGDS